MGKICRKQSYATAGRDRRLYSDRRGIPDWRIVGGAFWDCVALLCFASLLTASASTSQRASVALILGNTDYYHAIVRLYARIE